MSTPTLNVLSIIKELSSALGKEAVQAACEQFIGGKKKEKKERKPRGKSSWNLEVDKVLEEMQAACLTAGAGEKVTYKMAYAETSRRKREGDPEAQAKYETYRAKVEAKRAQAEQKKAPAVHPSKPSRQVATDANIYNFLFNLKDSGVTNMQGATLAPTLEALTYLQEEFGMSEEDAELFRKKYVANYRELRAKYRPESSSETAVDATVEQKKGRGRPKKIIA
jgi:hypothetical protein